MVLSSLNASQITVSTLTGSTLFGSTMVMSTITAGGIALSTLTVSTINGALPGAALTSTIVSIGASTNQTYNNFSNGSYAVGSWSNPKSGMTAATKTVMSATGQYQLIVANVTSGLFLSSDSGITWTPLTGGLPTLTGTAYWSDGVISANGQYITLSIYGGSLWMSADYGRTFALTNQPTPNIWLPFDGNALDIMGLSTVTSVGLPTYLTINRPGYTAKAVNLANTAGATATYYIVGNGLSVSDVTVSFWMNPQTLNNTQQGVFAAYSARLQVYIAMNNTLVYQIPCNGAVISCAQTTQPLIVNTWYYVTIQFQQNGVCSLYVNHTFIGSATNVGGFGTAPTSTFSLGTNSFSFHGYVTDLRIVNSVTPPNAITPIITPNIWLSFDDNVVNIGSDSMTPIVTGTMSYTFGAVGKKAVNLSNTAGGVATNYIRGAWTGAPNFTVIGWFNTNSLGATSMIFNTYNNTCRIFINSSNQLQISIPNTISNFIGPTVYKAVWYYFVLIFQSNGICSFYLNDTLITTIANLGGPGVQTSGLFSLGTYPTTTGDAFNGLIDNFSIYNQAFLYKNIPNTNNPGYITTPPLPHIYLPFDGNTTDAGVANITPTVKTSGNTVPVIFSTMSSGVATNGTRWVAVGAGTNSIAYSDNGINWTGRGTSILSTNGFGVATNGTRWVAVGAGNHSIAYSDDGINWTGLGKTILSDGLGVATNGTRWVAVGYGINHTMAYSDDGINWTGLGDTIFSSGGFGVATNGTQWVAVGNGTNSIAYSDDGINWTGVTSSFFTNASGVATNGTRWVVVGVGSTAFAYSDDRINWTPSNTSIFITFGPGIGNGVATNGTRWVAAGIGNNGIAYSNDGITWNMIQQYMFEKGYGVATNGTRWVVAGGFGAEANLAYSDDGITWAKAPVPVIMPTYVMGQVGTSALRLINPAGGEALQYVRGEWTPNTDFTISFWFNPQSLGNQVIFAGIQNNALQVWIDSTNIINVTFPNSTGSTYKSSYNIVVNTWYYVVLIGKSNENCLAYVNYNVLTGTQTNALGWGISSGFSLGTYTTATTLAFNGIIDDFKIYNSVIDINVPYVKLPYTLFPLLAPNIWLPFDNTSNNLGSDVVTPIVEGSVSYVDGVVGLKAIYLNNTLGPTTAAPATQYIRTSWSGSSKWTVSFWFNMQSYSTGQSQSTLFSSYEDTLLIMIYNNSLGLYTNSGTQIATSNQPTMNTWHYVTYIHQNNGLCSLYLNNSLVGTYNNPSALGTATRFSLGTYNAVALYPFKGYIDDFRIYNAAIPYHTLVPQNYKSLALSGTGQYALASAASGWVAGSSDSFKTWSKQEVSVGTQAPTATSLSINHTGQYQLVATGPAAGSIMPNQSGLASATWFQGGVDWTVSASSILDSNHPASNAFNNNISGATNNRWASLAIYTPATGAYAGSVSTAIQGISSAVLGEWIQLSSSVPLVFSSYTVSCGGTIATFPKIYYLVGSNDGSTWFPLQFANITTTPFTTTYSVCSNYLQVNVTGIQTLTAGQSGSVTTTSYSTSTQAYMYFRMVITHINVGSTLSEINELYINFSNSVSYSTNYGSTWLNTSLTVSNESVAMSPSGQYLLSTNSVTPFAHLTLNQTSNDRQLKLIPELGGGTSYSYSESNKMVGSHSLNINNDPDATSGITYFKYTVPTVLNTPPALSMFGWIYISSLSSTSSAIPFALGDLVSNTLGTGIIILENGSFNLIGCTSITPTVAQVASSTILEINRWYHVGFTFLGGRYTLYLNGQSVATQNYGGTMRTRSPGTNITTVVLGCGTTISNAFNGYIDDVRIYTSALNADEVNGLFKNPAITQTIAVSNSYLPITSYTVPVLPGITANVVDTAVSQTGQYMVAVTSDITNNVYYSTDFGTTFTAITLGTNMMKSCSISYDGSYLTVENDTTVYTLNRNTHGFSVAVGNQAGRANQSLNSIAIGNQAGQTNQSANSIILNATGSALNTTSAGLYVAPIADIASSLSTYVSLLGYGTDGQVIRTGLNVINSSGNVGISGNVGFGTTTANAPLQFANTVVNRKIVLWEDINNEHQYYGFGINPNILRYQVSSTSANHVFYAATSATTSNELMRITGGGNVGIGTNAPIAGYALHVVGKIYASSDIYSLGDITAFSDQRYKQNIVRLDRSLDAIRSLSGYSYTREDYRPGEKHIGLLAQEVLTVFPEAVSYDSTNDKYSVNYNCLIAPVVEAIKELYDRSEAQAEIIKSQQSVIESQGKTIQSLLARFDTQ